ncbi:MAG: toprim domain-containing protein [Rhodobacteraceae bacterium]|nr:toprim domain-containing protein [Paracoccaceae bacterium]
MESPAAMLARRLAEDAEAVCRHYLPNGRRQGRYWIAGDVENAPGRSLYVRLTGPTSGPGAAGRWTDAATGAFGDLLDLIAANQRHGTLRDTLDEARRFLHLPRPVPVTIQRMPVPKGTVQAARRLWALGQPIAGTLAERYLAARGLTDLGALSELRYHPACFHRGDDDAPDAPPHRWPALLAKVTDLDGQLTGLHRTWLDPATSGKAPLIPPRKAMGQLLGHGVRIGTATDVLAAGEGLETTLALRRALPFLPIVAALSASHLSALVLPTALRRLYIAVDLDAAGLAAADTLASRAAAEGIEAVRLLPRLDDVNDDLMAFGLLDLRAHLRPQLAPGEAAMLIAQHGA